MSTVKQPVMSLSECKVKLATMGWKSRSAGVGGKYVFEREPKRGRPPKFKFATMSLRELRKAAAAGAIPQTALTAATGI